MEDEITKKRITTYGNMLSKVKYWQQCNSTVADIKLWVSTTRHCFLHLSLTLKQKQLQKRIKVFFFFSNSNLNQELLFVFPKVMNFY